MGIPYNPKILVVTRKTGMRELRDQFATKGQAEFALKKSEEMLELAALSAEEQRDEIAADVRRRARASQADRFAAYAAEEQAYSDAMSALLRRLDVFDMPVQVVDRSYLPTLLMGPDDVIVTLGQDGLVANAAKYADGLPIIGVNPDPRRIDGVLLPFRIETAAGAVRRVLERRARTRQVTLGQVELNDGQRMLAFNDFFVGVRSHQSARYQISTNELSETQSSSGVLVSTGAGSTGWLSSMFNMAAGLATFLGGAVQPDLRMTWEDRRLVFVVREPFVSKRSQASLVAGRIDADGELIIESLMSQDGVIFSDGIEADFLKFNSGAVATIRVASERAKLVVG